MEQERYDLIIIGGGIASSFLCLSIMKRDPKFKILMIEKGNVFPQKIGESLVDLSALYVESLGIEKELKKHPTKTGIRFLFNESNSMDISDVSEFASPTLPGRIKSYHLDRSVFDEDMIQNVSNLGVTVLRPAEVISFSHEELNSSFEIEYRGEVLKMSSRWVVDATGRSRYLVKKLKWNDQKIDLNTGAIMTHFRPELTESSWDTPLNQYWEDCSIGSREFSTTHLMRKNSWWWIIRINNKLTSLGVVFDNNKIKFDDYRSFFESQIANDAQLSKLTKGVKFEEIKYIETLPYVCNKLYSKGIALIGESGAFIDPLISPGIELIGQQTIWLSELLVKDRKDEKFNEKDWKNYEKVFFKAYDSRLSFYKYAYKFMHSYDIFSTWLKQGNYIYFGWVVFPAILFKKRLKYPMSFNLVERTALKYIVHRFDQINEKRISQNRISKTKPFELSFSSVRVPNSVLFFLIPIHLLIKSLWSYIMLEFSELKYTFKSNSKT